MPPAMLDETDAGMRQIIGETRTDRYPHRDRSIPFADRSPINSSEPVRTIG